MLQALYQCDTLGDFSTQSLGLFFESFVGKDSAFEDEEEQRGSGTIDYLEFTKSIIEGIRTNLSRLDEKITQSSTHWTINRMSRVDRNILRLATYEILFCDEIPLNVTINEAVEIAKRYGGTESPMFINGVLDNLAHHTDNMKISANR